MKIRTIAMILTLVVAGLVIGCSSEPAAPTTTPVPIVPQIGNDIGQFLAQPNPKICRECNRAHADLPHADLPHADLPQADLSGANLAGAGLFGAILSDTKLSRAALIDAKLTGANLAHADLTGADLTGANLDGVIGADFTDAPNVPDKYLND